MIIRLHMKLLNTNLISMCVVALIMAVTLTGCKDEPERMDISLLAGKWKVVGIGHPDYDAIYAFSISDREEDTLLGDLEIYYLTATGRPISDRDYYWRAYVSENGHDTSAHLILMLKDVADSGESGSHNSGEGNNPGSDSDGDSEPGDVWEGEEFYEITKLTPDYLWLKPNQVGGSKETVKLRRYK